MRIDFTLLIYDGSRYYKGYPGIFIADYADLLGWHGERYDIFWECVEEHYYNNLQFQMTISASSETTIGEIEQQIVMQMGLNPVLFHEYHKWSCFLMDEEFVFIEDTTIPVSAIEAHYGQLDALRYFFVFSNQAGEIWRDNGLRYYFNSKEIGRHKEPHIHVDYKHEKTASICIRDGRVLDGYLPRKKLKVAQKRIIQDQLFLLNCWNKMTDGLRVDINKYWGIVPLEY